MENSAQPQTASINTIMASHDQSKTKWREYLNQSKDLLPPEVFHNNHVPLKLLPDASFIGTPLLFLVLINNVKVIITFDSGADVSVIPQKLADRCRCMAYGVWPISLYRRLCIWSLLLVIRR